MSEYQIWEEEKQADWDRMILGGGADMDIPETDDGFGPNDGYPDDSDAFRWEHEYKLKSERCASHVYVPTNFSDCYESEIMGRANGWVESAGV